MIPTYQTACQFVTPTCRILCYRLQVCSPLKIFISQSFKGDSAVQSVNMQTPPQHESDSSQVESHAVSASMSPPGEIIARRRRDLSVSGARGCPLRGHGDTLDAQDQWKGDVQDRSDSHHSLTPQMIDNTYIPIFPRQNVKI